MVAEWVAGRELEQRESAQRARAVSTRAVPLLQLEAQRSEAEQASARSSLQLLELAAPLLLFSPVTQWAPPPFQRQEWAEGRWLKRGSPVPPAS
jgi:hypothetical protein